VLSEPERHTALAAVALHAEEAARASARVVGTLPSGWRNSVMPPQRRILHIEGRDVTVSYSRDREGVVRIDLGSGPVEAILGGDPDDLERVVELDGVARRVTIDGYGDRWWVHGPWGDTQVIELSPFPSSEVEEVSGSLHAPMPGSVVSVDVAVGDTVRKGQTLVVLEAMKMEHPISCPEDGVVREVKVSQGEQVERGALLVVVEGAS
jgi:propionyl-CoA carboxylase alpha chain